MVDSSGLLTLGTAFIFLGIIVVVVAVILMAVLGNKEGKTRASGVVIIGPVPIIFGKDKKDTRTILKLSIGLTALLIAVMVLYYLLFR
jgi:uncharacterized protein (TIGR00304 family)